MKRIYFLVALLFLISSLNAQTADQVIDKHISKIGGMAAWNNIKSIQLKGKFNSSAGSEEILTISKKGKLLGYKIINGKRIVQFVVDGFNFWDLNNGKLLKRSEDMALKANKEAAEFPLLFLTAKEQGYKAEFVGEENILGKPCYKIKIAKGDIYVKGKKITDESFSFINKETYLEMLSITKDTRTELMTYTYYKDYKKVNNVLMPFNVTWFVNDIQLSINVSTYILNAPIHDSLFLVEN
ncbi:MAG: hypothetical protein ABIN48_14190 [Ginsengibacter sp.]